MKLDRQTLKQIEAALDVVDFGEIIIIVHEGRIKGVDIKCRKRLTDSNICPNR